MDLTDVVRVELVDTDEGGYCRGPQRPRRDGTEDGELALVEVVDKNGVELGGNSQSMGNGSVRMI